GDRRPFPGVGIDQEHAIAVAVDDLVRDIALQVAHAADGHSDFDALIGGRDPESGGPAATDAGDADALAVHFRPANEVIDAANPIPAFHAGRRIAQRLPPHANLYRLLLPYAISAVMDAGDFAELQ